MKIQGSAIAGVTLLEVLVGLAILSATILPLLHFMGISENTGRVRDLYVASALLKGETSIMYATNILPPRVRTVSIQGQEYAIQCSRDSGSCVTKWHLLVSRNNKEIAGIKGLLFIKDNACGKKD